MMVSPRTLLLVGLRYSMVAFERLRFMAGALLLVGCTAAPGHAPAQLGIRAPLVNSNNFAGRIIAVHNRERALAGTAPLASDSTLEAGATSYAHRLATTVTLAHSDHHSRAGVGENLWMGTHGAFSLEQMVGSWTSEKRMFVAGMF